MKTTSVIRVGAGAAYLRNPVYPIGRGNREHTENLRKPCEARDPEDSGAQHLKEAGKEANVAEVVGFQLIPRWPPGPRPQSLSIFWHLCHGVSIALAILVAAVSTQH